MSDWNDRRAEAEAAALEAMEKLTSACGELRVAVAADRRVQSSTVARLDLQRRLAWSRVNDALGYAESALGWDMPPRDPLFVHSEITRTLYAEVHSRGVALSAGRPVVAARNRLTRAAGTAERALEELGLVYDEHLSSPRLYPAVTGPLDRMRELHEAVAGPLPRKPGPRRPRRSNMSQRLINRMRAGRPLR